MDFILGYDKAITAAQIVYNEKISTIYFANSEGTYIKQEKLDIGSNMAATARRGMTTVSKRIGRGASIGFDCMLDAYDDLREACRLAVGSWMLPR